MENGYKALTEQVQSSFNGKPKQSHSNRKGVACIFRGGRNEEKITWAPKGASRLGEGGNLFRGARKSHFPRFSEDSFIDENIEKFWEF